VIVGRVVAALLVIQGRLGIEVSRAAAGVEADVERLRHELGDLRREVKGLRAEVPAVAGLAPLGDGYPLPFGGGYPMTADALAELDRIVIEERPEVVCELGGGLSTLIIGLTLKRLGHGRVISLDHDEHWAAATQRRVDVLGIGDLVSVLHAPLVEQRFGDEHRPWYDLEGRLPDAPINLLVVDGPPGALDPAGLARWPALPALVARLAPDAVVFVDDADRDGERRMVERWLDEIPGWESRHVPTLRGTAILRRAAPGPAS
jgi:predicted O-methyltransferase YrrM